MRKFSLFKRFTILSLIAFIITGLVLGILISNHSKKVKLNSFRDSTISLINISIRPVLLSAEFDQPLTSRTTSELDNRFRELKNFTGIYDITIWNQKGEVLYSSIFPNMAKPVSDPLLASALKNNAQILVTNAGKDSSENNPSKKVISVYAPIMVDNQVLGAFEVTKSYQEVEEHLLELNKLLFFAMFGGLLILYLFLLGTISRASRKLIEQNMFILARENELQESYAKLNATYKSTIMTLSKTVDARDSYTAGHSERVAKLSVEIGRKLGLSDDELSILELAAMFHDIGKLGVPDNILKKPRKLTELEFNKVKEHPVAGVQILQDIGFLEATLSTIKHHHEHFSGGGYPDGIMGEDIPYGSRIIAVADTYDAMTSDRPYRTGLSHQEAVEELVKFKAKQFDPVVVEAFLKIEPMLPGNNILSKKLFNII